MHGSIVDGISLGGMAPMHEQGGLCVSDITHVRFCFVSGLVMRSVGDTMIISPPRVISREEIDELVDKARAALDVTHRRLAVTPPDKIKESLT